ncbi:MAG TPA: UDP-N-acetylmuramate--L-alanine ligase, partial [Bdellovibrionales bacterium]|nr:UDP-N-acetylmuramate--L-alanine ligase [Bdellovibrionales bacterium]
MRLAQAKVHFIGIGGIGMCGLAELLRNMGGKVSGSDLSENAQTTRLRAMGIDIKIGHAAANVSDCEVVVYSSAVKPDNPEFKEARRLKIPLIPRAEALAEMMRLRRGVAVGGSHGKTTTTSLTASIFMHAKAQPTIVVGGRLDLIKSTALLGQGEWLIAEADESDGSFSRLSPEIVIVTNIDNDHLDYYGTVAYLKKAFFDFAMRIPFYGLAIVCGDDPAVRETFADFGKRILFYGFEPHNDLRLEGSKGEYDVYRFGEKLGHVSLGIPGKHNALNAAAALAAGLEAGFSFAVCAEGLAGFRGVDRRFQHKGVRNGVDVFDDYGHHPTEVQAVLNAFKEKYPGRRLVTVFQPHRYSRTHLVWDQFVNCFADAGDLYLCDIYAAGEDPIANVSSERMVRE